MLHREDIFAFFVFLLEAIIDVESLPTVPNDALVEVLPHLRLLDAASADDDDILDSK